MAVTRIPDNLVMRANLHRLFGQYEPGGDWREIQVDESGYLKSVLGPGDEAIGAVEIKDHDSGVRADVSATGSLFGNGLHALCYIDPTGRARAASVDAQGRLLLSNVDIQIGAVELKNFDTNVRAEVSAPGTTFGPALHTMPFIDATGRAQAALVDESGHLSAVLAPGDEAIGAVELKDHDSALRASITNAGDAFGPALHVLPAVDTTGHAQPLDVDPSGWLRTNTMRSELPEGAATEATLAQARDSLDVVDDWDQNDRAKTSPIPAQDGVAAGGGATDALTQRVVPATDSPTFGVEDAAAPTETQQVGGKHEAVRAVIDDGDLGPLAIDAYKGLIGTSDNLAIGAKQIMDIAPVVYDGGAQTARAAAALPAAGAYDAAPTEIPLGGLHSVLIHFFYDEDAGATDGRGKFKVELCQTVSGSDEWAPVAAETGRWSAAMQGQYVEYWQQPKEWEFDPLTADNEGITAIVPVGRAHKIRIPCCESGDVANPGQAEVFIKPHNN